ncbi:hypothetical protein [Dyadobacter sp. SG02]|uniref:hypothetical protein n=1 Tax=Dyadobacter sp. SG02 TaxID=1855291 RepID=UPI000B870818|nr:hypothetical protein [Dyadobacter sp. SG02]
MSIYLTTGRIFFGLGIMGIGILQLFSTGVRSIIIPELKNIPSDLSFIVYFIAALLISTGLIIIIGKKFNFVSLFMGILFLALFLFGHLPWSLSAGSFNNYWVNTNKILALSGGFLAISTINARKSQHKIMRLLAQISPLGIYLYAIMLYNFAVGHFNNLEGISNIVPKYIPFPEFWTFLGGVTLMGSAISIFSSFKVRTIMLLLALNLFIWLLLLHLYYNILYPQWQDNENFIGSLTCLCFCGTALVISQTTSKKNKTYIQQSPDDVQQF